MWKVAEVAEVTFEIGETKGVVAPHMAAGEVEESLPWVEGNRREFCRFTLGCCTEQKEENREEDEERFHFFWFFS